MRRKRDPLKQEGHRDGREESRDSIKFLKILRISMKCINCEDKPSELQSDNPRKQSVAANGRGP